LGATSADTQREIEEIRKDVSSAVSELEKRLAHAASPKTYVELARENPAAVLGLGVAGLGVAGTIVARAVLAARRRNRPSERLRRTVHDVAEGLGEQLGRAREVLPTSLPIGLHIGTADDGDDRGTKVQIPGSQPSMVKRLLWAALVAAMMAAGGLLARRVSATLWRQLMREDPPTASV
jgi:hypothetical protein